MPPSPLCIAALWRGAARPRRRWLRELYNFTGATSQVVEETKYCTVVSLTWANFDGFEFKYVYNKAAGTGPTYGLKDYDDYVEAAHVEYLQSGDGSSLQAVRAVARAPAVSAPFVVSSRRVVVAPRASSSSSRPTAAVVVVHSGRRRAARNAAPHRAVRAPVRAARRARGSTGTTGSTSISASST